MKVKIIIIALFLATISKADDTFSPEVISRFIIKASRYYTPESVTQFSPHIDYKKVRNFDPTLTDERIYNLINSVDSEELEMRRIEEPPHEIVVEIIKPNKLRFYFSKKKSNRPSPHTPKYHEEWDYTLIGIKEVQPVAPHLR